MRATDLRVLVLERAGEWGDGFEGFLQTRRSSAVAVALADFGARGRAFWRRYARANGLDLAEATGVTSLAVRE